MSSLLTETYTTTVSGDFRQNSSYTITTIANIANSLFNDTWLQIGKTASAPLTGEYLTDHNTNNIHSSSINNISLKINTSLSMIPSDDTTISGISSGSSYSFLENFINATTIPSTLNSSLLDEDIVVTTETPYVPYVMRPETYIVPVLFAFIFIVGVLGNGTLIIVFLTVRQMRNVPNT